MDLQDKYDELDNIISTIRNLKSEITDKDYIEQLEIIQYQAQNEIEEIEPRLQEMYDSEEKEQNLQYERSVS